MSKEQNLENKNKALHIGGVSGILSVTNGFQLNQKHIYSNSNWFTEEYYTLSDDGECLTIVKCYLEIPKNAHRLRANKGMTLISDIPNGKYEFNEEESNEDELVVYYR